METFHRKYQTGHTAAFLARHLGWSAMVCNASRCIITVGKCLISLHRVAGSLPPQNVILSFDMGDFQS